MKHNLRNEEPLVLVAGRLYHKARARWSIVAWMVASVSFTFVPSGRVSVWLALAAAPWLSALGCFLWHKYHERRFAQALYRRWSAVPDRLRLDAYERYGRDDGMIAAITCYESHLPGDCPLCGAE